MTKSRFMKNASISDSATPVALVHHANQFLITNGYDNREGIDDLVGNRASENGYLKVLELHRSYRIPINLNVSGTLLEAIAWHRPDFLEIVKDMMSEGLLELIGSAYGQNIMRFFSDDYNRRQLVELFDLYKFHLGADPSEIRIFWSPERVWETEKLAPLLASSSLPNGGYQFVLLDDRLRYPVKGGKLLRHQFDKRSDRIADDFRSYRIRDGHGLSVLPISRYLRESIPPTNSDSYQQIKQQLEHISRAQSEGDSNCIGIFADDMEKAAGIASWGRDGLSHYEEMLKWANEQSSIAPTKLSDWTRKIEPAVDCPVEVGSFMEMSSQFGAGEGLDEWYFDPAWKPYRDAHRRVEDRLNRSAREGADPSLIDLAWKQLLVSGWETAWHTPATGVHGDPSTSGEPSPWAKAVAGHSRLALVVAEAAEWMAHRDGKVHADLCDIDSDGEEELVLKNDSIFSVFSPNWGGRLVYLFHLGDSGGRLVVGNPADDWNWMEELNKYMEIPPNHPGSMTHLERTHDRHEVRFSTSTFDSVEVELKNVGDSSPAFGLCKSLKLRNDSNEIEVEFDLSTSNDPARFEFGMSPDYLNLLRFGREDFCIHRKTNALGCSRADISTWIRVEEKNSSVLENAVPEEFGHGVSFRVPVSEKKFRIWIGTGLRPQSPLDHKPSMEFPS
ncbi:hypothetical protein MK489_19120 [Myxococcota bacterium]|nr:hypothetical protein [Myxococcota bacterium]